MKVSKSMRVWFALMSMVLWTGIYLTGFSATNWLLYIPATVAVFAAITGICPSLIFISKLINPVAK